MSYLSDILELGKHPGSHAFLIAFGFIYAKLDRIEQQLRVYGRKIFELEQLNQHQQHTRMRGAHT